MLTVKFANCFIERLDRLIRAPTTVETGQTFWKERHDKNIAQKKLEKLLLIELRKGGESGKCSHKRVAQTISARVGRVPLRSRLFFLVDFLQGNPLNSFNFELGQFRDACRSLGEKSLTFVLRIAYAVSNGPWHHGFLVGNRVGTILEDPRPSCGSVVSSCVGMSRQRITLLQWLVQCLQLCF